LWRRRESNGGPVSFAENAGAIRSVDSGEESGAFEDGSGSENAPENAATSDGCSRVASGTTPTALLELVDAAITALDAGETDVVRGAATYLGGRGRA